MYRHKKELMTFSIDVQVIMARCYDEDIIRTHIKHRTLNDNTYK